MAKISLIYHMNSDHALLDRDTYLNSLLAQTGTEKSLDGILTVFKNPISLSSVAKDWIMLFLYNRASFENISDKLDGSILNGLFSQSLPSEYPDFLGRQLEIGNKSMRLLFGDRLSPFGFMPEFDIRSEDIGMIKQYWDWTIALLDNLEFNSFYDYASPSLVRLFGAGSAISMPALAITKGELRKKFLDMYRTEKETLRETAPKITVSYFETAAGQSQDPILLYLSDLEVPLLNRVIKGSDILSPHKLEVHYHFASHFSLIDRSFVVSLDNEAAVLLQPQEAAFPLGIRKSHYFDAEEDLPVISNIAETASKYAGRGDYLELLSLISMSSDYIIARKKLRDNMREIKHSFSPGGKGIIIYKPSQDRILEQRIICDSLNKGQTLDKIQEKHNYPNSIRTYLNLLDGVIKWAERSLY